MGSFLSSPATDADLLASPDAYDSRSLRKSEGYNGAQPSGTESAQREETEPTMRRPTTPYIPNVLATPTNVSSPILAAESSIPTTYTTALESTRDDNTVTKQPTSQMNDPNVTPSLFSPIAMEPTIIPETPSIYETPMDRMPISPQPDQLSSDRRPSERKNMEESPSYRRRHRVQSRLNDRAKMTSELAADEGSEDEEPTNIVRSLSRPSRHKDRSCSRDRRQMRTSSEDLSRRHRKKTAPQGSNPSSTR